MEKNSNVFILGFRVTAARSFGRSDPSSNWYDRELENKSLLGAGIAKVLGAPNEMFSSYQDSVGPRCEPEMSADRCVTIARCIIADVVLVAYIISRSIALIKGKRTSAPTLLGSELIVDRQFIRFSDICHTPTFGNWFPACRFGGKISAWGIVAATTNIRLTRAVWNAMATTSFYVQF